MNLFPACVILPVMSFLLHYLSALDRSHRARCHDLMMELETKVLPNIEFLEGTKITRNGSGISPFSSKGLQASNKPDSWSHDPESVRLCLHH